MFIPSPALGQGPVPAAAKWLAFPELLPLLFLLIMQLVLEPDPFKKLGRTPPSDENKPENVTGLCVSVQAVFKAQAATHHKAVIIIII